jgi:hypothetical protein
MQLVFMPKAELDLEHIGDLSPKHPKPTCLGQSSATASNELAALTS